MATVIEVSDYIETRLKTISGLRASDGIQDTVNPPAAMPLVTRVEAATFDTRWDVTFRILVISGGLSGMGLANASRALKTYMAPSGSASILAALDQHVDADGIESIDIGGAFWDQEREYLINGVAYWGAPLENVVVYITEDE